MENKDINKLFRQAFEEAEHEVNPVIWQNIENELDENAKRTVPFIFKAYNWIGYAAAILIILSIGFFIFKHEPVKQIVAEQSITEQGYATDHSIKQSTENIVQGNVSTNTVASTPIDIENTSAKDIKTSSKTTFKETVAATNSHKETKPTVSARDKERREELPIASLSDPSVDIKMVQGRIMELSQTDIPTTQVTEIDPIKPLIVFEEEEESMYAVHDSPASKESTVITTILNKLSENIDLKSKKEVRFKSDDEGSILVDFINPLARNRNKKRK